MRFKRLTIRNYRGVDESTVEFAEKGITLIQGPNEAGKSSLAESINILFQYKASTASQKVNPIKPVHRDAGPEVELEAVSGKYHFVYNKRFFKAKTAELVLHEPEPLQFTDDAAHDRANRILEETLDKKLWDALIIRQGDGIGLPDLSGQAALMRALDASAGGDAADAKSENLYDRVMAEHQKYFHVKGKEGAKLTEARERARKKEERFGDFSTRLADMEKKVERLAFLRRMRTDLASSLAAKREELAVGEQTLREIGSLATKVREQRIRLEAAEAIATAARRDWEERLRLVAAVEHARSERERLASVSATPAEERIAAAAGLREHEALLRDVEKKRVEAEWRLALAQKDFDHFQDRLRLDELLGKNERVRVARGEARAARSELTGNRVDSRSFEAITAAAEEVASLQARLTVEAPRLGLSGLGAVRVVINGGERDIAAGENIEYPVSGRIEMELPGQVRVTVDAGHASETWREKLSVAEERLAVLCSESGVADVAAARTAAARRHKAERDLADAERREGAEGVTTDFEAELARLREAVEAYAAERAATMPLPDTLEAARAARGAGEELVRRSRLEADGVRVAREERRRRCEELTESEQDDRLHRELAAQELARAENELSAACGTTSEDALRASLEHTKNKSDTLRSETEAAEAELRERNQEREEAVVQTLRGTLASLQTRLTETEREQAALTAEVRVRGEEGLYDAVQEARIEFEEAGANLAVELSRANAARALFETMRAARESARRSYIAPLKEKVEELGRWVFNSSFRVALDEESLGISTRTLDGVTVDYDSLSGGAREQLSLIFRAACCMLVSEHEGMPLILDDALGYTDTGRLRLMGAVLAKAAEQCQIIIFTCVPERYASVGNAKVVQLP